MIGHCFGLFLGLFLGIYVLNPHEGEVNFRVLISIYIRLNI